MQYFVVTIVAAIIGGLIGKYLKLPVGAMLGSLTAAALVNIVWGIGHVPDGIGLAVRIIAGASIGSRITKSDLKNIKSVLFSAVFLITSFILVIPVIGFIIYSTSNLDITTSLFASTPGGMTDMALIADELGADSPKVLLMQLIRLLSVLFFMPVIAKTMEKRLRHHSAVVPATASTCHSDGPKSEINNDMLRITPNFGKNLTESVSIRLGATILIGSIGGIIGVLLNLPAGSMIGSMLAVAFMNISTGAAVMPKKVNVILQISAGALLGSNITTQDILGLKDIAVPGMILVVSLFLLNLLTGYLLHRFAKLDLVTALLASAPGGVTEMTIVGDELGADTPKISILQLARLISVIIFFPFLLRFICLFV